MINKVAANKWSAPPISWRPTTLTSLRPFFRSIEKFPQGVSPVVRVYKVARSPRKPSRRAHLARPVATRPP